MQAISKAAYTAITNGERKLYWGSRFCGFQKVTNNYQLLKWQKKRGLSGYLDHSYEPDSESDDDSWFEPWQCHQWRQPVEFSVPTDLANATDDMNTRTIPLPDGMIHILLSLIKNMVRNAKMLRIIRGSLRKSR